MEVLRGIKIRDIFLDNQNWWNFYLRFSNLIRESIVINVCKILICNTEYLGFHQYLCPKCDKTKKVFHTCKSRFCSSCGKKATEQWIERNLSILPQVPWQHITFTLPQELRDLFWLNRHLFNHLIKIPAKIITKLARHKQMLPGIFLALHTFGRDLKPNVHFHLSTTSGGLSLDGNKWVSGFYIHHQTIKNMWKYEVVSTLRRLYKKQRLILLPELKHIQNYTEFNKWLQFLYQKSWVVHLQKTTANHNKNVKYLGRYLKRPPLSETRITNYDGENITYFYHDHHDRNNKSKTMSVFDFIQRLVKHIPDSNFRLIRYYNWLSNRTRGKLLPIIYALIKQQPQHTKKITWYDLFHKSFGYDPLLCKICKVIMEIDSVTFPTRRNILSQHQVLATTAF